jgi:hypothetical protein
MATELSISDLAEVLAALKEGIKPYKLGIQLKIDSSELDEIERNHPKDIDRQKTEVVKCWLRNSSDASWTTLANAVERMGGHARLVKSLREKEQSIMGDTAKLQEEEEQSHENTVFSLQQSCTIPTTEQKIRSRTHSLDVCVPRSILLLGKMGHGKSTLGNRMLDRDGSFKINDQRCPQTAQGSSLIKSVSQRKDYKIEVYDHSGLFEGATSIDKLSSAISEWLNLVIFAFKGGYDFDVSEVEKLRSFVSEWKISRISALVLTHCECLSEEERGEMIKRFKKDHPSIAELMGKGILAVGFPDSSHVQPESPLSRRVEEDKANLRQLIYLCDEPVSQFSPQNENRRSPQNENLEQLENIQPLQNENGQPHQNENRRCLCCSIL